MTRWFRDTDQEWYKQQNEDQQWIEENNMAQYTQVFEGFLNDNSDGVLKNENAPKYRSSGSGKSAIVTLVDIPAGSVIALAAWGGSGQYGNYIKITGQLVQPDAQPQTPAQQPQAQQQPSQQPAQQPDPFNDDIPF